MNFLALSLSWFLLLFNVETHTPFKNSDKSSFHDYPTSLNSERRSADNRFENCGLISTLPCENVSVNLPFNLSFNSSVSNTIIDKNNEGTGFTMVDAYSGTRHSADGIPSNPGIPGYEASKLTLVDGRLQIISNKGIAYLTNNNQLNSLGVQFNSQNKYQVETVLINPFNGTSAQQAGIWIGQNDKSFLKLVVVGNKLEFRKELNDASVVADTRVTGVISGLDSRTVYLRVIIDSATNSAEAFYSIDSTNYINVGAAYSAKGLSISGMNLTGSAVFSGIFATHRNSSAPVTYTFDSFNISAPLPEPEPGPEPTPTGCSPISTLACSAVQLSLPINLTFDQSQPNTITDKDNQGIGFTMADAYSGTRHSADGTPGSPSVPGYEASRLSLGGGRLQILSNKGIAYLTNNNQLNALGVQFNSQNKYQVETVLINPFNGSSAQQAGIWIGQNDKSFLKLVAVGNKLEFRKELNDASVAADTKVTAAISGLDTRTVNLRLVIDPATNIAEAFYSIDGTNYTNVGSAYSAKGLNITGMNLTGSTVFSGIFATHRNSATPVTYTFDNFSVSGTAPDPDPEPEPATACSPISTLPCAAVQVSLPLNLTFDVAQANTITDKDNQGIGFTMVDAYTGTRLSVDGTISNTSVPGYEASKLTLGGGRLQILSNKGIAYLTNNNQLNALGVKFDSQNKYQIETVIINPFFGTSAQQAGIWIGNDNTFLKLVTVGNKLEFRKELNDVSGNSDTRVTGTITGLNTRTVNLRIVIDPATNSAEAFYSIDGANFINVGDSYSVKGLNISEMALTGGTAFAGIFATHRSSSTPVTYTFDNFSISTPDIGGTEKSLSFSAKSLDFTVMKNGTVISQSVKLSANTGTPSVTFTNSEASWFTSPSAKLDTITIGNSNISSDLPPGVYKVNLIASAPGYQPADLLINLTVLETAPTTDPTLSFSARSLDFTVLRNGTVRSQAVTLTANTGTPSISFTNTEASWFTSPPAKLDTITIGNSNISSDLPAGSYKLNLIASASGYEPADLLINLTVIEPIPTREVTINFQDSKTIPPPGAFMDYGQPYGLRTTKYQDLNKNYGWKKRSDGSLLDLTRNGRNRMVPDDVLLATIMHVQADDIAGSFTGTRVEGIWEYSTTNGEYDVTISVGDANPGIDPERHTINAENVNIINAFVPSGDKGSSTRFYTSTSRVTVSDGKLTLNADSGFNTKISSVKFKYVSPYIFWARTAQNLLLEQNSAGDQSFTVGLGNSLDSAMTYNLSVDYGTSTAGWLTFNPSHSSSEPNVNFNYSEAKNLPAGIYTATVTSSVPGFTSSSLAIQLRVVDPARPYVISSSPTNGAIGVSVNTVSVAANKLYVPAVAGFKGGVDNSTITTSSVKLLKIKNGNSTEITGVVQGTGGGDVISFSPSFGLEAFSEYKFLITEQVKSYSGASFIPFESTFKTGAMPTDSTNILNVKFTKIPVAGTQNKSYSSLTIGPDDKFYALRLDGVIERYTINHADGSLTDVQLIETLVSKYGERSAIGITFDPSSTASDIKVWISHCSAGLTEAPSFDGNISLLSGSNLENEQLIITRLPRSTRDHLVNSLAFGPDGALYFNQGSNSSMGDYDPLWQRNESLLSAAVLRLDLQKLSGITLPLNVETSSLQSVINSAPSDSRFMSDGTYNPYSTQSPLTLYASGVRNAYDLVWHSNGQLYVPTNGSGGGGSSPVSAGGTRRPNGTFYSSPDIPATKNVQAQPDLLFRINPLKSIGYYGHPNPTRGEYVPFRGYLDNPVYPSSIIPDVNYRGTSYDFGLNISANGSIEYKNEAFGGRLKGKLIVCRFSGGGDLIVLEPGSMVKSSNVNSASDDDRIYNIVKAATGSGNNGMEGMSAFVNPLDLVEDVQNGNLYVIEFNWNGDPKATSQITLLQVDDAEPTSSINTVASLSTFASSEQGIRQNNMINKLIEKSTIKVYPNPVTGDKINFQLRDYKAQENISIILFDMMGRVLKQAKYTTNDDGSLDSEFSLNNTQNNQYYIMKVNSMNGAKMIKILVQ